MHTGKNINEIPSVKCHDGVAVVATVAQLCEFPRLSLSARKSAVSELAVVLRLPLLFVLPRLKALT